jgi:hypothetical protein
MYPHNSRDLFILRRLVAAFVLVSVIITSCNMPGPLSGEQGSNNGGPLATSEQPLQGSGSSGVPAVMGFVLDPDGESVAYSTVGGEFTDSNGAVSGDLTGSASGWLEVNAPGYATGYEKPGEGIGKTLIFETRLTPFEVFLPLESGKEVMFTLGDIAQPVAEVSIPAGAVSSLPAYVEAAVYERVDVGPYPAELDSGEALDLKLAIAVEATSDQLELVSLASGKTLALTLFPGTSLPANPVLAIFDPVKGKWEVQAGACTPGEAGALLCAIPRFSPLIGFFGPSNEIGQKPGVGKLLLVRVLTGDDQAYQDAMTDCEEWLRLGQGLIERTGSVSAEWEAEMTNRIEKLADAAEAYADTHPDSSGLSHLLAAAQLALKTGQDPAIADKLMKDAREIAAAAAEALLENGDCGRIREMLLAAQQLILLGGSQAIIDALMQKLQNMGDCDEWIGHMNVWFTLTSTNPGLDKYQRESGGSTWHELHLVHILTNVQTHVLKGEDRVTLKFPDVRYGKRDRHDCHNYLTHGSESGSNIYLKFDGQYDGYTFTVGDMQPEGGTATITYGAHMERWDDEKEECEEIQDQTIPAPNYSSILVHGMMGSPPITMQQILQGEKYDNISGSLPITNDAFDLGIHPWQTGIITWSFMHTQKYLPLKQ